MPRLTRLDSQDSDTDHLNLRSMLLSLPDIASLNVIRCLKF